MSPALIRLLVANSAASRRRLLGVSAGIAIGVALLVLLLGSYRGLELREGRASALTVRSQGISVAGLLLEDPAAAATALNGPLVMEQWQNYAGRVIDRLTVAVPEGSELAVPGLAQAPDPGTYRATPALQRLIEATPRDQLGDRFGEFAGLIERAGTPSPDSLIAIVGAEHAQLVQNPEAFRVDELGGPIYGGAAEYGIVAVIGGIALLIPVLVFVSIVTNLGAAERRDRFAAIRLLGATPGQLAGVAAAETAATAALGAGLGVFLARLIRPLAAQVPVNGGRFFPEDLSVGMPATAVIVVGVVLSTSLIAGLRLLRARLGPLGNVTQAPERPVGWWRLLPLAAGVTISLVVTLVGISGGRIPEGSLLIVLGFALTMVGLLLAGPLLTAVASGVGARLSRGAAGVIALNRIRRAPRATFRAVSGLVIAVFAVSLFAGAVTSERFERAVPDGPGLASARLLQALPGLPPTPAELGRLAAAPGVAAVAALPWVEQEPAGYRVRADDARTLGLGTPAETAGSGWLLLEDGLLLGLGVELTPVPEPRLAGDETQLLLVRSGEGAGDLERARTAILTTVPDGITPPRTAGEQRTSDQISLAESFTALANLGLVVVGGIASVSLAVATVASVIDRRRVLGLLRLMGMPTRELRGIIVRETVLPLLSVVAVAVGLGFFSAWAVLAGLTEGRRQLGWPEPSYPIALGATLAVALLAVLFAVRASTRETGRQVTRFE